MRIHNIFAMAAIIFSACNLNTETSTNKKTELSNKNSITLTDAQLKNASLEIGQIGQQNISTLLKANGIIDVPPQNIVSITTALGGYLKSTKLLLGMQVKKGDLIATIENQDFIQLQQDYLSTNSKLNFAQKEYQRQKELNLSQSASDKILQQAEGVYRDLQITQSGLVQKLNLININTQNINVNNISKAINIYAPISGFVSKVNVNIGRYITPSDELFEIINANDIHLNLKIYEKDLKKLKIGQNLFCYSNSDDNQKYPCTIRLISNNINIDHSVDVICSFKNYVPTLLPGMYMNAEIRVENNASNILPENAVVSFEGKDYIFIAQSKNNFEMTEVEIGTLEDGNIEIKNIAMIEKKNIVIKNAYTLLMALKNTEEE